jgi:predicted KAP-like P-loop ATPase
MIKRLYAAQQEYESRQKAMRIHRDINKLYKNRIQNPTDFPEEVEDLATEQRHYNDFISILIIMTLTHQMSWMSKREQPPFTVM